MEFRHKPVMLKECIEELNIKPNGIYVDGTLGGAGHSEEILKKLNTDGLLVGIDRDEDALKSAKQKLSKYENVRYVHGNHDDIKNILDEAGIDKVNGILLDLGVSSYQLDERNRGFSYMGNAKLDMRMDQSQDLTAEIVVNEYSEEELTNLIFEYGEERFAKNIAKNICKKRKENKITTTEELVEIIRASIPLSKQNDGHPAKRTFQAIRIEVNNELGVINKMIEDAVSIMNKKGRICIITFHSLEDRIVKNEFKDLALNCVCPPELPICQCNKKSEVKVITRKPILPSDEEVERNPRARSAKLRVAEKK